MQRSHRLTALVSSLLLLTGGWLTGCQPATPPSETPAANKSGGDAHAGHDHDHPTHGPRGGDLIELGQEEYHLELIHDAQSQRVQLFLLDGSAQKQASTNAEAITVNLKAADKTVQFQVPAVVTEEPSDPAENHHFELQDEQFHRLLDDPHATGTVVITINGKQYRGQLRHDHAGHQH